MLWLPEIAMFPVLIALILTGACLTASEPEVVAAQNAPNKIRKASTFGLVYKTSLLKITSEPPSTATFTAYDSASLACVASGYPPPVVYWMKDGVRLVQMDSSADDEALRTQMNDTARSVLAIGHTMATADFSCIRPEDGGEYSCVAENGHEVLTAITTVTVTEGDYNSCPEELTSDESPKIVMWTTDRLEFYGSDARLYCRATGDPKPSIRWYTVTEDETELPTASDKYEILANGDLVVRDIDLDDNAEYVCVASNIHGEDRVDAMLLPTPGIGRSRKFRKDSSRQGKSTVKPSLKFYGKPGEEVTFTAYRNATLECTAGGTPPPTVYWTKDGMKLSQVDDHEKINPTESSEVYRRLDIGSTKAKLHFACVKPEDSGEYACIAENGHEVLNIITTVKVVPGDDPVGSCSPESDIINAPKIVMWTSGRFEYIGSDVKLFCRAEGNPQPVIEWYEMGEQFEKVPVSDEKYEVLKNGDLVVRDILWYKNMDYVCMASNTHGTDTVDVFLYPTEPGRK